MTITILTSTRYGLSSKSARNNCRENASISRGVESRARIACACPSVLCLVWDGREKRRSCLAWLSDVPSAITKPSHSTSSSALPPFLLLPGLHSMALFPEARPLYSPLLLLTADTKLVAALPSRLSLSLSEFITLSLPRRKLTSRLLLGSVRSQSLRAHVRMHKGSMKRLQDGIKR